MFRSKATTQTARQSRQIVGSNARDTEKKDTKEQMVSQRFCFSSRYERQQACLVYVRNLNKNIIQSSEDIYFNFIILIDLGF